MNIIDKKEEIIQRLQSTTDEELIQDVYELVHADDEIKSIQINSFTS